MASQPPQLTGSAPVSHFTKVKGMNYSTPPHLLPNEQWRFAQNVRFSGYIKQIPRQIYYCDVDQIFGSSDPLMELVSLPSGASDYATWLAFTNKALWQVRPPASSLKLQDLTESTNRWSVYVHNGRAFFTNDANRVRYCDGASVQELFQGRACGTVDNRVDTEIYDAGLDDGPFAKDPFFTWDAVDKSFVATGHLSGDVTFNWTTGTAYRVYVERPKFFPVGSTVSITRSTGSPTTTKTLTGRVTRQDLYYIVVEATNTVSGVSNVAREASWAVRVTDMFIPSGRFVTVFFDHVVVGAPHNSRGTVRWSHLYDYAQWTPGTDSEADSYECTDYQRPDDIVTGITGLQHYKELLLIFTPSCIYAMQYTGLPRVVRVAPIVQDYGCGLPYGSAALDDQVVWVDVHNHSFYTFRGQGVEEIGAPIADYFFSDLSATSAYAAKTFTFVDRMNHEVTWVYVSTASTSGYYDKAVVYNYQQNTWTVLSLYDNITCFGRWHKRAKVVEELSGTCDAQTGTCDALEETTDSTVLVFGIYTGVLSREAVASDLLAALRPQNSIILETGDLIYGSAQKVKEVHSMTINASGTFTGIKVEVSARESVGTAVTYVNVGTWTPSLATKMLTFPSKAGKVLRYRFTVLGDVRDFVFYGFEDNVLSANADR